MISIKFFVFLLGFTLCQSLYSQEASFEFLHLDSQKNFTKSSLLSRSSTSAQSSSTLDFGSQQVGSSRNTGFRFCATVPSGFFYNIRSISISRSDVFPIISDGCSGRNLRSGYSCCTVRMKFRPRSVGSISSSVTASLSAYLNSGVLVASDSFSGLFVGRAVSQSEVSNNNSSPVCPANSSVNIDKLALYQEIPLVGVPGDLHYNSSLFRADSTFDSKKLGLGGWSLSNVYYYDFSNGTFYKKSRKLPKNALPDSNGNFYFSDQAGNEIYFFDENGNHLQTKDALTGAIKWSMSYKEDGRLESIEDAFGNKTTLNYEEEKVSLTSPFGQTTTLHLNSEGLLSSVTNPNNEAHTLTYDSNGYLTHFTKPEGQTSIVEYDQDGYVIKDEGAGGDFLEFSRIFEVDADGFGTQSVTMSTALGKQTIFESRATEEFSEHNILYATGERRINQDQTLGEGQTESSLGVNKTFNKIEDPRFGKMASYESESRYQVSNSAIDLSVKTQRFASFEDPSDPLSWTSLTTTTQIQNDPKRTYTSTFESGNLLTKSPMGKKVKRRFNDKGQLTLLKVAHLSPIKFRYNKKGLLTKLIQGRRVLRFKYNRFGLVSSMTNPLGQVTKLRYDKANRLIKKVYPDGSFVRFHYDKNGNLTILNPNNNKKHRFKYNLLETVSKYLPPKLKAQFSHVTTYEYDLEKRLTKINQPTGESIEFEYDRERGLLDHIHTTKGSYNYSYKADSDLVSEITTPKSHSTQYYYVGNLIDSEKQIGEVNSEVGFLYNSDSSLGSLVVIGENAQTEIRYVYDRDNLIKKADDEWFKYNKFSALSESFINQLSLSLKYNDVGALSEKKLFKNEKIFYTQEYKRDNLNRVVEFQETKSQPIRFKKGRHSRSRLQTDRYRYHYSKQGYLTEVQKNYRTISRYSYDNHGNRISAFSQGKYIQASYDSEDRLIRYGDYHFEYNENGDIEGKVKHTKIYPKVRWLPRWWIPWLKRIGYFRPRIKTERTGYRYDSLGNLVYVKFPSRKKVEYIVDGKSRRIGKKVNGRFVEKYIYQSQTQIVGMEDHKSELTTFVYADQAHSPSLMIKNNIRYKMVRDHLGSIRMVVHSESGKVMQEMEYDAFGNVVKDTNPGFQPFGFAGGLHDRDTGLVRFGARDYNPVTGRWMQKDPIGFEGGDTNLYRYINNDPVNFTDPKGTVSPASITACFVAFALGETFDLTSNIRKQVSLQEEFETKINALENDRKSCSNTSSQSQKEKQKLLDEFQRKSLGNIAEVFTPGAGGKAALGACIVALATF